MVKASGEGRAGGEPIYGIMKHLENTNGQKAEIFEFMRILPTKIIEDGEFKFQTPAEIAKEAKPVSDLHVPYPISWADEERDVLLG